MKCCKIVKTKCKLKILLHFFTKLHVKLGNFTAKIDYKDAGGRQFDNEFMFSSHQSKNTREPTYVVHHLSKHQSHHQVTINQNTRVPTYVVDSQIKKHTYLTKRP